MKIQNWIVQYLQYLLFRYQYNYVCFTGWYAYVQKLVSLAALTDIASIRLTIVQKLISFFVSVRD